MKKLLGIIALVAIAAAASWNFSQSKKEAIFSDLVLANINALAENEGVEVVCSKTCRDGIGKCWFSMYGTCIRSESTNIYCTC